jgi:hypothetical protein
MGNPGPHRVAISVGALVATIVACAEPQHPRNDGYVDRLCTTFCQKRVQCDANWEEATCQKNCRQQGSPARAFWREDYVKATLECVDSASCDVVTNPAMIEETCFRRTRPEPSALAKKYCDVAAEKDRACVGVSPDLPRCLRFWGMINDAVMNDLMIECEDRPCRTAARCAHAMVGFDKLDDE